MWTLTGNHAVWNESRVSGAVDLTAPGIGISLATPLAATLLGVQFPDTPTSEPEPVFDAFVRGSDVVVSYGQTVRRTVQPQVYWRFWEPVDGLVAGCEAIVSAQTSLLDSRSGVRLVSQTPDAGDVLSVDVGTEGESPLLLVRVQGNRHSVALMVDPTDFAGYGLDQSVTPSARGSIATVTANVFGESLEKGVIRRGRAAAVLVEAQDDVSRAIAAYARFVAQPLPLTA